MRTRASQGTLAEPSQALEYRSAVSNGTSFSRANISTSACKHPRLPNLKIFLSGLTKVFLRKPKKIDVKTIKHLTNYFKEDIKELKKMNINMENWREY